MRRPIQSRVRVGIGSGVAVLMACASGSPFRNPENPERLSPEQRARVEDITTLCLEVRQAYPEIQSEVSVDISEGMMLILGGLGVGVVESGSSCDARLVVSLSGSARSGSFRRTQWMAGVTVAEPVDCYYWAGYAGTLTLSLSGESPISQRVGGAYGRSPEATRSCARGPQYAPFPNAWKSAALFGLATFWGPQEVYAWGMASQDPVARAASLDGIGRADLPHEEAVDIITEALADEDFSVRLAAARSLQPFGSAAAPAVPGLVQVMREDGATITYTTTLGAIGPAAAEAVPEIVAALEEMDRADRIYAHRALRRIGPAAIGAVPALIERLGSDTQALATLRVITGQSFGLEVSRWQQWWENR